MKNTFLATFIVVACSNIAALARADFVNGNNLLAFCNSSVPMHGFFCFGYIEGIADAMQFNSINGSRACIGDTVQVGQLNDVVIQFLQTNPAIRDRGANSLVAAALGRAFPCR